MNTKTSSITAETPAQPENVPTIMDATEAFAVPGEDSLIDCIHPQTGRSWINDETLEQVRERYPKAERVNIEAFCKAKAEKQDTPVQWSEVTRERYWEMLEVLPPAAYLGDSFASEELNAANGRYLSAGTVAGGFLVGEPSDHHAGTGQPRYAAFVNKGGKYYEANRPMQRREFLTIGKPNGFAVNA